MTINKYLILLAASSGAFIGWFYEQADGHPYAGIIIGALVGAGLVTFILEAND